MLSGFLITGILIEIRGRPRYFSSFYARRALRIIPVYYVMIAFSYHLLPHFPDWHRRLVGMDQIPPEWDFWLFLSNVSMARQNDIQHGILGVSWSLAIEEQFYIVWAAVVWLCPPRLLGALCGVIVAFAPLTRAIGIANGATEIDIYVTTPYRADSLAFGGLLAWLVRQPFAPKIRRFGPAAVVTGIAGVAGLVWWDGHTSWDGGVKQAIGYSFLALAASGLLLIGLNPIEQHRGARWMAAAPLRMFGRYSYCLYLIHLPVMWTVRGLVFDPTRASPVGGSVWPAQLLFWVLVVTPAVAIAACSWRFFETPILRLKRFFPY